MSTRREFILNCSVLTATAAMTPSSMLGALPRPGEVSLDSLSLTVLTEQLNTPFAVADRTGLRRSLRLASIRPFTANRVPSEMAMEARRECFSLLFFDDDTLGLSQDTYRFEHPRLGRFEMFIVPVGQADAAGSYYEAVFDRSVPVGNQENDRTALARAESTERKTNHG